MTGSSTADDNFRAARRRGRGRWRFPGLLGLLLVVLLLGGCYEIPQEIIPAALAELVPDAPDQVDFARGGKMLFSRAATGNDYRFREITYSGSERQGSLRALRIKDDIYAVQARYDGEAQYLLLFYTINAAQLRPVDVTAATDLKTLASLYGAEYWGDELAKGFRGSPEKILALLRGLSAVDFEP